MAEGTEWPRAEQLRSYIPNRIARLRRRKLWADVLAWVVVALGIVHAFTGTLSAGAAIVGLGLLGRFIALDLCNLYIDVLSNQWADLDRDMALKIDDCDTPMRVPPQPF